MNYAIIIDDEIVNHGSASELWPNTSFVGGPDADFLASHAAVEIQTTKEHDIGEVLEAVEPYLENGVVYKVIAVAKLEDTFYADWKGFSNALLLNSSFEAIYLAAAAINPLKSAALLNGFQYAEQGNNERFLQIWSLWKSVANIPPEKLIEFKETAASHHIPEEIVNAL